MAGAGYKLFNTGDVLTAAQVNTYLQEQTVMVFADATARTTALSGVLAEGMVTYLKSTKVVEIYNGTAWASLDDPNAIQNTIVDAKGDLISATAADTPARLAVGADGDTLVASSSATTGLRWQATNAAGKNCVINGGFDIWQRGTSSTTMTSGYYTADRWKTVRSNNTAGYTVSRVTSFQSGTQYAIRLQRTAGNTSTDSMFLAYAVETADWSRYQGQTLTFSFYAKGGANYSPTSGILGVNLYTGTGTDQDPLAALTGEVQQVNQNATITTSATRYSYTFTVPSNSTDMRFNFSIAPTGTAGAADLVDITGVQIEVGSVATAFTRAGGTLAGELAACQRYFEVLANGADATNEMIANLQSYSTTQAFGALNYKVTKRGSVTLTFSANTDFRVRNTTAGTVATTTMAAGTLTPRQAVVTATVASGLTAGSATNLELNSATGYIWAASEL